MPTPIDSGLATVVGYIDVPCTFLDPKFPPGNVRIKLLSSRQSLKFLEEAGDDEERSIIFCAKTDLEDGWVEHLSPESHERLLEAVDLNFKTAEARVKRELKKVSRLGPLAKESLNAKGSLASSTGA